MSPPEDPLLIALSHAMAAQQMGAFGRAEFERGLHALEVLRGPARAAQPRVLPLFPERPRCCILHQRAALDGLLGRRGAPVTERPAFGS